MWTRCLRTFECDPIRAERAAALLSRAVAGGGLLLIVATWPLWTSRTVFPRVPFLSALLQTPTWLEVTAVAVLCGALLTAFVAGSQRRSGRWSLLIFAGAVVFLTLADQHRWQPWAYQLFLLALILALLPAAEAIAWARLLVASIYFYSALSKLDWTFLESGGGQIVDGLCQFLHIAVEQRGVSAKTLAGSFAVGELLVAIGLCRQRSRRTAFAASLVIHGVLLAALGPWGAGNKPGVLLWNLYFIAQNIVLFGIAGERAAGAELRLERRPAATAVRCAILIALLFPLSQPFGICDVWPAWAVYATGPERLRVYVDAADREKLPPDVRPFVDRPRFEDDRCLVRIDRWSLDTTRAPLYPQSRYRLGVALASAHAAGIDESIYVELETAANRWTGRRTSRAVTGSAAIRAELNHDWLNGIPRPFGK